MTHPDIEQIDGTNKEIKKTTDKPSVLLLIAHIAPSNNSHRLGSSLFTWS